MQRSLQLARNGLMGAAPNPMVGAVIVHNGRIIGEGWHRRYGGPHAEVNAIRSVLPEDEHLLRESTIYVSLEPCSHWGKTPPCAELIVEKGLRRVVVGCMDPFAKVQGRGIQRLLEAGIEVVVGVLEQECLTLNERFITFHTHQRPWVTLKWAESADGFIDRLRDNADEGEAVHFSTPWTQMLVHRLRATHQAILVGRRTWELDHPSLTTRHWIGPSPKRYILTSLEEKDLFPQAEHADVHLLRLSPYVPLHEALSSALHSLHAEDIQSLLVEGGRQTLQAFIDADIWDEAYIERSKILLHEGVQAPHFDKTDAKGRPVHVNFI